MLEGIDEYPVDKEKKDYQRSMTGILNIIYYYKLRGFKTDFTQDKRDDTYNFYITKTR